MPVGTGEHPMVTGMNRNRDATQDNWRPDKHSDFIETGDGPDMWFPAIWLWYSDFFVGNGMNNPLQKGAE